MFILLEHLLIHKSSFHFSFVATRKTDCQIIQPIRQILSGGKPSKDIVRETQLHSCDNFTASFQVHGKSQLLASDSDDFGALMR